MNQREPDMTDRREHGQHEDDTDTRGRYVRIRLPQSRDEINEIRIIEDFNRRYAQMSPKQKNSPAVRLELNNLRQIYENRRAVNRQKVLDAKRNLAVRGFIGLTEEEWQHQSAGTGLPDSGDLPPLDRCDTSAWTRPHSSGPSATSIFRKARLKRSRRRKKGNPGAVIGIIAAIVFAAIFGLFLIQYSGM